MKKSTLYLLIQFFFFAQFCSAQNWLSDRKAAQFLVQTHSDIDPSKFVQEVNEAHNLDLFLREKTVSNWNIFLLESKSEKQEQTEVLSLLSNHPGVKYASPNRAVTFRNATPNDSLYSEQWYLERIALPSVWDITKGGQTIDNQEIVVAVIDSGFDENHPDLEGQILGEAIHFRQNPIAKHGTAVSGILAAKSNNEIGVTGTNWHLKMLFLSIHYENEIAQAYDYVYQQRKLYNETDGAEGAFIVAANGSFGFDFVPCGSFPILSELLDKMGEEGVLYVGSVPNENSSVDARGDFPSGCESEYLITVTSANRDDELAKDAAFGQNMVDLAAPGTEIWTPQANADYQLHVLGGSSYAAPLVSGAVALLYSTPCPKLMDFTKENPAEAALLVKDAILNGVEVLPDFRNKTLTEGRLNVFNSMEYLHGYCIAREEEADFAERYLEDKKVINLYPNPTLNEVNIEYSVKNFKEVKIEIYNALGQLLYSEMAQPIPFEPQTLTLDVSQWESGVYVVTIVGFEQSATKRFVKS